MKLTPLQSIGLAVPCVLLVAGIIFMVVMPSEPQIKCPVIEAPAIPDDKKMTNDEIITEVHKCEASGLKATAYQSGREGTGSRTVHIECGPK